MSTWEELRQECLNCRKCGLCQTRTNVVFGVGKEDAEVMFIGEGPGQQEDLKGEPFVGRSGQLLDKLMATVDLFRDRNIYIANTVKCRPPQNRTPFPEEAAACLPYLRQQVALVRPQVIVLLGATAAKTLLRPDFRITREHGQWEERKGVWLLPTYHPAALLRDESKKRDAWHDLQLVMAKLKDLEAQ